MALGRPLRDVGGSPAKNPMSIEEIVAQLNRGSSAQPSLAPVQGGTPFQPVTLPQSALAPSTLAAGQAQGAFNATRQAQQNQTRQGMTAPPSQITAGATVPQVPLQQVLSAAAKAFTPTQQISPGVFAGPGYPGAQKQVATATTARPGGTATPATTAQQAPTIKAPGAPQGTQGFTPPQYPKSFRELMSNPQMKEQYAQVARNLLAEKYGPQISAAQQAFAQQQGGFNREREALELAGSQTRERARRFWAGKNLSESGFLAGNQNVVDTEVVRQLSGVGQRESAALGASEAQVQALRAAQASGELPLVQQMLESDRTAGLQERGQSFREHTDSRDFSEDVRRFGFDAAIREADANLRLQRGYGLLPYEIEQARLANEQGAFNLDRGRALFPGELAAQQLGIDRTRQLLPGEVAGQGLTNEGRRIDNAGANQQQYQNNVAFGQFGTAQQAAQLQSTQLANRQKELELKAREGPVSEREQLELQEIRSRIASNNALAAQRASGPKEEGFTAWQQYQMLRDELTDKRYGADQEEKKRKETEAARKATVEAYRRDYRVSQPAVDMWVSSMELVNSRKADGSRPTKQEVDAALAPLWQGAPLTTGDREWLDSMLWSTYGANMQSALDKYLRNPPPDQD